MNRTDTGLVCILCEAGLSYRRASLLAAAIDRLRIASISGDDLAALLLNWSNERASKRLAMSQEQINKLLGVIDEPRLFYTPN